LALEGEMARHNGRHCTICRHPQRERIEALRAGGATLDSLASRFKCSRDAVHRHMAHVPHDRIAAYLAGPATIAELRERAVEENGPVIDYLVSLRSILMGRIVAAAEANAIFPLAALSSKMIDCLKEIGKISGEITRDDRSIAITNNVAIMMSDPKMVALQEGLLRVAREVPDARGPIVALLRELDDAKPATGLAPGLLGPAGRDGACGPDKVASARPGPAAGLEFGPPIIEGSAA
jgi:hypothetical protein